MYPCTVDGPRAPALYTYYAGLIAILRHFSQLMNIESGKKQKYMGKIWTIIKRKPIVIKTAEEICEKNARTVTEAVMSLLVVILAVSLIWIPFVQLITEFNTIFTKVVIYFNAELLGFKSNRFHNAIEAFFLSQHSLVLMSVCGIGFVLYLASSDFLVFAACYICNLPNTKYLKKLKEIAMTIIQYLLNLKGQEAELVVRDRDNIVMHHGEPHG